MATLVAKNLTIPKSEISSSIIYSKPNQVLITSKKDSKYLPLLSLLLNGNCPNNTRASSYESLANQNVNMEKIIEERIKDLDEISDFYLEEDEENNLNDSFNSSEDLENNDVEQFKILTTKSHQKRLSQQLICKNSIDLEIENELNEIALELLFKKK